MEFWEREKKCWKCHHFTHVYRKPQSYEVRLLRYGVRQTEVSIIWASFCPFTSLTTRKIEILKKRKKHLEMSSFYTCVPKITIKWYMPPEIRSATDIIFLSFWTIFCPFTPLLTQKTKIWKNVKKPGDISLLHLCTINEDHMMYSSWDIKARRTKFFVILGHFLLFDPPNKSKNPYFEIMKKKHRDIIILHVCIYHKWLSYDVWFLRYGARQQISLSFRTIFCYFNPPPHNNPENQNFEKMKNAWRSYYFARVYHKWKSYNVWYLTYGVRQGFFSFWIIFALLSP